MVTNRESPGRIIGPSGVGIENLSDPSAWAPITGSLVRPSRREYAVIGPFGHEELELLARAYPDEQAQQSAVLPVPRVCRIKGGP